MQNVGYNFCYLSEQVFFVRLFQSQPDTGELISIQPPSCFPVRVTLVRALITCPVFFRPDGWRKLVDLITTTQLFFCEGLVVCEDLVVCESLGSIGVVTVFGVGVGEGGG